MASDSSSHNLTRTKTALVTGASSGIGYAVVKELAHHGFTVYACARREEVLRDLAAQFPKGNVIPYALDITNITEIVQLKEYLATHLPQQCLDVLYNNAGQSCCLPAVDLTDEILTRLFRVNVIGHMDMTTQLAQLVINAKGTILFTGSLAGLTMFPFGASYAATKAAIHQYARVLHGEMKIFDVRVINAVTGGVDTEIADKGALPRTSLFHFKEGLVAFEERKRMVEKSQPMSADKYAHELVADILSSRDPLDVYRGSWATVVSWLMLLAPYWLVEWILFKKFKLDSLHAAVRRRARGNKQD